LIKISILLPFYNRHELVRKTVASVLAQTYPNFELIIVDDGSVPALSMDDLGAAAGDSRIQLVRQANAGSSVARNKALSLASGDYILFLDSDDLLANEALEVLATGTRGGEVDAVVGNWTNFTAGTETAPLRSRMPYRDALANAIEGDWVTGGVLLRRGLNPEMSSVWIPWEVAEFYQRAMQSPSATIAHVDRLVVRVRQDAPGRLTNLHDHFEPSQAGAFWRAMKRTFPLNDERRSAFDHKLFRFAFSAHHSGQHREAEEILAAIDIDRLDRYPWYTRFSPAWFVRWGGRRFGLHLQELAHNVKNRLVGVRS
jgi:glycosyltransferase involved in cell wall biosynthesis